MRKRLVVLLASLLLAGCMVTGMEPIMPEDPDFQLICVDSLATDSARACYEIRTIELIITIKNPNA